MRGESGRGVGFGLGVVCVGGLGTAYALTALVLSCGGSCGGWIVPVSVVFAGLLAWFWGRDRHVLAGVGLGLAVWGLGGWLCCQYKDYSWDGFVYHQEIIAWLMEGLNPYRVWPTPTGEHLAGEYWGWKELSLWGRHYGIAMEMLQADAALFFDRLHAGRVVNIVLATGAGGILWEGLRSFYPSASWKRRVVVTMITVCNPVVVSQILTYYNDFSGYYYYLVTVVSIAMAVSGKGREWWLIFASAGVLAVGTKFNIFFYEAVTVLACAVYACREPRVESRESRFNQWNWKRFGRLMGVGLGVCAVGMALAWHPYITNWIGNGNPFYPLMGRGGVDIMTGNTPEIYRGHGRVWNFVRSLWGPVWIQYDSRAGGFGPGMGGLLLLSAFSIWKWWRKMRGVWMYIIAVSVASVFVFAEGWWARYVPQLWFAVGAGAAGVALDVKKSRLRKGVLCCYVLLAGMSCLSAMGIWFGYGRASNRIQSGVLESVAEYGDGRVWVDKAVPQLRRVFSERGVECREGNVESLLRECGGGTESFGEGAYFPRIWLDEREYGYYKSEFTE